VCYRLQEDCRFNPTISLENEIVAQGQMNTSYHQGYPVYPSSWLFPYVIVRYTSISLSGINWVYELEKES
jgi:hypothetical protein